MYNNCDQLKCWIRQGKPSSKAFLEHCEGAAEQVTPNSNPEKRHSACLVLWDTVPGDLQRSFPASGILWLCDIYCGKKNSLCYSASLYTALQLVQLFFSLTTFPPPPRFALIFSFIFVFGSLLFSLCHVLILLQHVFNNGYAVTYSVYSCSLLKKTLPSLLLRIKKAQLTPVLCL